MDSDKNLNSSEYSESIKAKQSSNSTEENHYQSSIDTINARHTTKNKRSKSVQNTLNRRLTAKLPTKPDDHLELKTPKTTNQSWQTGTKLSKDTESALYRSTDYILSFTKNESLLRRKLKKRRKERSNSHKKRSGSRRPKSVEKSKSNMDRQSRMLSYNSINRDRDSVLDSCNEYKKSEKLSENKDNSDVSEKDANDSSAQSFIKVKSSSKNIKNSLLNTILQKTENEPRSKTKIKIEAKFEVPKVSIDEIIDDPSKLFDKSHRLPVPIKKHLNAYVRACLQEKNYNFNASRTGPTESVKFLERIEYENKRNRKLHNDEDCLTENMKSKSSNFNKEFLPIEAFFYKRNGAL